MGRSWHLCHNQIVLATLAEEGVDFPFIHCSFTSALPFAQFQPLFEGIEAARVAAIQGEGLQLYEQSRQDILRLDLRLEPVDEEAAGFLQALFTQGSEGVFLSVQGQEARFRPSPQPNILLREQNLFQPNDALHLTPPRGCLSVFKWPRVRWHR